VSQTPFSHRVVIAILNETNVNTPCTVTDPLNYDPRPWSAAEDAKVLALKANVQFATQRVGVDYLGAVKQFTGRPRFEIRERREVLIANEKKKASLALKLKQREHSLRCFRSPHPV
jgi:hypothetical protein